MCLWLLEPPVSQNFDEVGNRAMIEASLTLLDKQVKVLLRNAVIATQMTLGLPPEVLDSVDVIDVLSEQFRVVNPDMMELGNAQNIIDTETVGVDDGVRSHLVPDDWKKRVCASIWDDNDMNLATWLQEPEDQNLARCAAEHAVIHGNKYFKSSS